MVGWRKKPEGFEWHKYIRTTIKVRREHRRQRVIEARQAAGQQMNAAGAALAAGSRAVGAAARDGARAGLGTLGLAAQSIGSILGLSAKFAWRKIVVAAQPIIEMLARPNVGGPIALVGGIALGLGVGRYRSVGLDAEALATLLAGIALLIVAWPALVRLTGIDMPRQWIPGISPRVALLAGGVGLVVLAGGWLAHNGAGSLTSIAKRLPLIGASEPLAGRAQAVGGDLLRIGSTTVRLAGIEAPEREQRCGKGSNRQWRCGAAAEAALARLVNGRNLRCTQDGSDSAGYPLVYCLSGTTDVNGELVRQGHVFAATGLFARYGSLEGEARVAKAGIWSGDAERPAEYRAKAWAEAKRRAPDGCPIKGLVTGSGRVYVLPWSPDYERGRIQKARGERWFCSEQEAVSAGFKAAARS